MSGGDEQTDLVVAEVLFDSAMHHQMRRPVRRMEKDVETKDLCLILEQGGLREMQPGHSPFRLVHTVLWSPHVYFLLINTLALMRALLFCSPLPVVIGGIIAVLAGTYFYLNSTL